MSPGQLPRVHSHEGLLVGSCGEGLETTPGKCETSRLGEEEEKPSPRPFTIALSFLRSCAAGRSSALA